MYLNRNDRKKKKHVKTVETDLNLRQIIQTLLNTHVCSVLVLRNTTRNKFPSVLSPVSPVGIDIIYFQPQKFMSFKYGVV